MTQATEDQVKDILSEGLTNFAGATCDLSLLELAQFVLRDVREVFVTNINADDTCSFAFAGMIIRPEIRVECFVAVLNDKVIVAWRKGLLIKKTVSCVIPKHTIKQASWAVFNRPGVTRGNAAMLTIVADDTTDILLPKDYPAFADAVVAAVQAR